MHACTPHMRIADFMQSVKEALPLWHLSQKKICCAIQAFCLFIFNSCPEATSLGMFTTSTLSALLTACPQGTFKSFQGAGLCQQCPLNSRSTIEAATLCGCRNGYYRGDMDKPEDTCTSESHTMHTQHTHCDSPQAFPECRRGVSNTPTKATKVWTGIASRLSG